MAPAATIALNIRSSILVPREKVGLFRNCDATLITVAADQDFDHIRDAAVLARGCFTHRFLDGRVDAQIQRRDFGLGHALECNVKE